MAELKRILDESGIDTSTLKPWQETDRGVIWTLQSPGGTAAIDTWQRLRALVAKTGHWPVLLGQDDNLMRHGESRENNPEPVSGVLAAAEALTGADVIERRRQQWQEQWGDDLPIGDAEGSDDDEWPDDVEPSDSFSIPFDIVSRQPLAMLHLALVPTERPWEVPAFLAVGNWNECPPTEEHVALMRHWHEQFGAEVVGISGDVVEMLVSRPPADRASALRLAHEQFMYCSDIVTQGTESVTNLAATLLNGRTWYFWWD